jgi:tRNA A-37 threonylcarbamoyl transferase component Bud32
MPDLEHMSVDLDRDDVLLKLKHTMKTRFHDNGLWHNDPAWRNVAVVRDKKGIISKVCMIDLEPEFMIENVPGSSEWKGFDEMWTGFQAMLHADWEHFKVEEMA